MKTEEEIKEKIKEYNNKLLHGYKKKTEAIRTNGVLDALEWVLE